MYVAVNHNVSIVMAANSGKKRVHDHMRTLVYEILRHIYLLHGAESFLRI